MRVQLEAKFKKRFGDTVENWQDCLDEAVTSGVPRSAYIYAENMRNPDELLFRWTEDR